jgi:O-antigen/teichoic acid export membrane protein
MSFATQATTWLYDVGVVAFVLTALGMSLDTVALLAFAYTFAKSYLGYAFLPFGGLLTPLFTRIRARNDQAALQETYGGMTRMFALLLIPAGVGLAILTRQLLVLLYPRYVDTATVIYILIAFTFVESLISIPHNVLMVYERYWPVLLSRLLALIGIPLLIVLVLLFPSSILISAAIAVGVARVLPRVMTLLAIQRDMQLYFPTRFVGRVMAATVAMSLPLVPLTRWLSQIGAPNVLSKGIALVCLLAFAGLGGLIYLVVLRLLGGLDEQERKRILSLKLPFKTTLAKLL